MRDMTAAELIEILGTAMVDKEFLKRLEEDVNVANEYLSESGGTLDEIELKFLKDDLKKIRAASNSLEIRYDGDNYGGKGR